MSAFYGAGSSREADDLAAQELDQLPDTDESDQWLPVDDAEWLYGNSPGGLRYRAALELAEEFGTDVSEWLV